MTQVSILQGIYTNNQAGIVNSLPINFEPTIQSNGLSEGYLSDIPGITLLADNNIGRDRVGINWNGVHYRVQGSKLVKFDSLGNPTIIGDVGDDGNYAFMDYGFDRLAISSNGFLWYLLSDGTFLQVTDPLAVNVNDVIWVDGYYMFTDGENIVVTKLNDPTSIIPTNYGTAELDPDPIVGLIKLRDEVYAIGKYTIQNFQNVGGSGFPFATNDSAFIPKGCVGPKAFCIYKELIAFVGSGKNEDVSIYLGFGGSTTSICSNAVSKILQALTADEQTQIELEQIVTDNEFKLFVHLPDQTLVYYWVASQAAQTPIWTIHRGGVNADVLYPIRHFVYVDSQFVGATTTTGKLGYLDYNVSTQFGETIGWEFTTSFIFNQGGFTLTNVELFMATGIVPLGVNASAFFSYSRDGVNYSQERSTPIGNRGDYNTRVAWRPMCDANVKMSLKFRGTNTATTSIMRLDVTAEGSNL